jgi:hypothetical protein
MASLRWIQSQVERYALTTKPIQSVLQITIETKQQEDRHFISDKLKQCLANVAPGLSFYFNPNIDQYPIHYITQSTYSDLVKAELMKKFFQQFNAKYEQYGKVDFLLSRPLEYYRECTF